MLTRAPWLADVLRAAGLAVVEVPGWQERGHGDFTDLTHVVLHHDASPFGPSPGVVRYMLDNFGTHGAQLWVARDGTWTVLASGVAYHAGRVQPGKPGNRQSLGVEADHSTGEDWPDCQLNSIRVGIHAILTRIGTTAADGLEFHKTVCRPHGRKSDPDGLSLDEERIRVDAKHLPTPTEEPPVTPAEIEQVAQRAAALVRKDLRTVIGGDPTQADVDATHYSLADIGRQLSVITRLLSPPPQ